MEENILIKTQTDSNDFGIQAISLVRDYVIDNFMYGDDDGLEETTSFQESGIIDSTGILELVDFIEQQFSITISDQELVPENLDSIQNVVRFLDRKGSESKMPL